MITLAANLDTDVKTQMTLSDYLKSMIVDPFMTDLLLQLAQFHFCHDCCILMLLFSLEMLING